MSLSLRPLAVAAIVVASAVGISAAAPAVAAELKPVTKAPPAPPAWWDTFEISGHVEGGITGNSVTPVDGLNFGHLFTDRANTFLLNQALLTIQRPVDPKATGFDAGFKFQAMYGTDARYPHFLGEFDQSISSRNQVDIVEAHALFHLPWLTSGGIDVKVGQYVTLEGAEAIPASDNLLYTHSYIFNFGIPAKHTGIMTTTHVTSLFELHLGIDTGVNTTFNNSFNCFNCGDNNHAAAFHGGLGFNLLDGKLTILATTHIGPENPNVSAVVAAGVNPNQDLRYLNDVTITFKPTDRLTFMTDLNYIRDDGFGATGGGVAQTWRMPSTTGSRSLDGARFGGTTIASSSPLSLAISISSWPNMAIRMRLSSPAGRPPMGHSRLVLTSRRRFRREARLKLSSTGQKFVTTRL
jgi:putative OmpL-like beta-barrel porin-2